MPDVSPDPLIDLRSDTVTRPDAPMYEALREAPLGDDVFGDDPTVLGLEERVAQSFGKEAALFVPTGTMANAIAVGVHCDPGDEILLEGLCHTFNFECGGAARLWGVQARPVDGEAGRIPIAELAARVRPDNIHMPRSRLVLLEQTSNVAGGKVLPLEYLREVGAFCRSRDLAFHIDGARIFNASVAAGVPVAEYAACADSLMFCVSKGLGAPAGSLLVGVAEFIAEARSLRKLLGGGLRQVGVLAACARHALEHNVERLAEDHRRAARFAADLGSFRNRGVTIETPETNMVFLRLPEGDSALHGQLTDRARLAGVAAVPLGDRGVRFVFHKDIDDRALERATSIVRACLETLLSE